MNQWVEKKDGKWCWFQQYSKDEMSLLRKYHTAISRMTNMNLKGIL